MEQWNSESGTVWWNSGIVMVEKCGATEEQWISVGGIVEQ